MPATVVGDVNLARDIDVEGDVIRDRLVLVVVRGSDERRAFISRGDLVPRVRAVYVGENAARQCVDLVRLPGVDAQVRDLKAGRKTKPRLVLVDRLE